MDAFSASLMADKREIVFAPTVYKFQTFAQMAEEFKLGERDVVLTNEFIYTPFMKDLNLIPEGYKLMVVGSVQEPLPTQPMTLPSLSNSTLS